MNMPTLQRQTRGAIAIIAAMAIWSSLGIFIRLANASAPALVCYSALVALVIQSGMLCVSRKLRGHLPTPKAALPLLILGPVTLANTVAFFYALKLTSIANALTTHYLAPVLVAILASVFLKERFGMRLIMAISLSTAGLIIIVGLSPAEFLLDLKQGGANAQGIAAGAASAAAYATLIILARVLAQGHHPFTLTIFQNVMMAGLLLPFVEPLQASDLITVLIMGSVHSTIAPVLYFVGLRHVEAAKAAILGYLEPVCAVTLGALILNELPSKGAIAGGILILISGAMVISNGNGRKSS